mmetsp:Transcript_22458/g.69571  ORF Transcript_22458/g.69571 Transcript_22458/m.69571 type:complete len:232 (-) Transcript_22458:413-1108(-)
MVIAVRREAVEAAQAGAQREVVAGEGHAVAPGDAAAQDERDGAGAVARRVHDLHPGGELPGPVARKLLLDAGHVDVGPPVFAAHVGCVHHALHVGEARLPLVHFGYVVFVGHYHELDAAGGLEVLRQRRHVPRRVEHDVKGIAAGVFGRHEVARGAEARLAVVPQVEDARQPRRVHDEWERPGRVAGSRLGLARVDRGRGAGRHGPQRRGLLLRRLRLGVHVGLARTSYRG